MGVIEVLRVQLGNGLFHTIEKPTSLPTATLKWEPPPQVSSRAGRPKGRCGTRNERSWPGVGLRWRPTRRNIRRTPCQVSLEGAARSGVADMNSEATLRRLRPGENAAKPRTPRRLLQVRPRLLRLPPGRDLA